MSSTPELLPKKKLEIRAILTVTTVVLRGAPLQPLHMAHVWHHQALTWVDLSDSPQFSSALQVYVPVTNASLDTAFMRTPHTSTPSDRFATTCPMPH